MFVTKPDKQRNWQRVRIIKVLKKYINKIFINKNLISRKPWVHLECKEENEAIEGIVLPHLNWEQNNKHGYSWKFCTIVGHMHTPYGYPECINNDYNLQVA